MTNSLETGGSERQFVALARSLDRSAFSLKLGCLSEKGGFRQELGEMKCFNLGGSLYSFQSFRSRVDLARYLRSSKIAIAHAFDFYTNLVLIPVAKLIGIPVVLGSQRQLGDLLTPGQSRAQAAVLRWCDTVVCNSQAAADQLVQQNLSRDKLTIIRNGVPESAFAEARPALPRVPGVLRVGMIARMNHLVKNHSVLIAAAARVVKQFPSVEFVLVGDGPLRETLQRQVNDLGITEQVRFLGDRRDIPAILASLDVAVLPSASESLSNSIIEAMAAGVPVVATKVGGNIELVDETRGLLVPVGDESALSDAITRLLRDSALRTQLGANAKAYAKDNFTIDEMRRRHEELYMNLLRRT